MGRWPATLLIALALLAGCAAPAAPSPVPAATVSIGPTTGSSRSAELVPTTTAAGVLYAPADLDSAERQEWLDRIEWAAATLAEAELGPLDVGWDGQLVVELPTTQDDYLGLAGVGSGAAAATTRCDSDSSRIAINPVVRTESSSYLDSLLLHEGVHTATDAACTDSPLWIEEGLAEWLTAQHDPATQQANQQWLDYELASGLPSGLPMDASFGGSAAELSGAYALAVFAVATAIEHLGQDQAMAYFAAPDEQTTGRLTQWYLAGLQARLAATASVLR